MIEEIKFLYHEFSDAILNKVTITSDDEDSNDRIVKICVTCLNWQSDQWETIELHLKNVFHIQYTESIKLKNIVIFESLISNDDDILIDFFPIQVDGLGELAADPKSSFLVKCKFISYKVVVL